MARSTSPSTTLVHRPLPFGLLAFLVAAALCLPTHPLVPLAGAPLGILGGVAVVALLGLGFALGDRQLPRAGAWVVALLVLAGVRWIAGLVTPAYGFEARYWADEQVSRPPERSTEFSLVGATRLDRWIHFAGAEFPVHFFNDQRRFNFYRPTDVARDTLPFSVSWRGTIARVPDGASKLVLVTNGPASLTIDGQQQIALEYQASAVVRSVGTNVLRPGGTLELQYTRVLEGSPLVRLWWETDQGHRDAVGAPSIVARDGEVSKAALDPWLQWLSLATTVALIAVVGVAAARSRSQRIEAVDRPLWARWERVGLAVLVMWAAVEPLADWLSFEGQAILLSGGNDWLAYESYARDVLMNGPLMNYGRPLGTGEAYYYQPAYAYGLAGLHALLGESLAPILWVQFAALGFVAALMFALARALWGPLAGAIAAGLTMALRELELGAVSSLLLSENLLFVVLPLTLLAIIRAWQRPSIPAWLVAGALLGLAGLTRSTPLALYPFVILALLLGARRLRGKRHAILLATAFSLACAGVVSLATIRNLVVSGSPVVITSSAGANLIEAHRPTERVDLRAIDQNPLYERLGLDRPTRMVLEYIRQDPMSYLASMWPTAAYALGYPDVILPGRGIEWPLALMTMAYAAVTLLVPAARQSGAWVLHAFILTHALQTTVFFSHQYGYRLPLPMYLPMAAVIGGAAASVILGVRRRAPSRPMIKIPAAVAAAGLVALIVAAFSPVAATWTVRASESPERLYALEGDPASIARLVRDLPDEERMDRVYGTGNDTRTREIAYLRGLAYPLIKWVDTDTGLALPGRSLRGLIGLPDGRAVDSTHCIPNQGTIPGEDASLVVIEPRTVADCLDGLRPANVSFDSSLRVIGAQHPSTTVPGGSVTVMVAWEVLAKPDTRFRPQVELLSADGKSWVRAESNPYGADLWAPGEIVMSRHELRIDPTAPPGEYAISVSYVGGSPQPIVDDAEHYQTRAQISTLRLTPTNAPLPPGAFEISHRTDGSLGDVRVIGSTMPNGSAKQGDSLDLTVFWQAAKPSPAGVRSRLELRGPTTILLGSPRLPLDGRFPLAQWRMSETVRDDLRLTVPASAPPGTYEINLTSDDGSSRAALGSLTVEAQQHRMDVPQVRTPVDTAFGDQLRLTGGDVRNRRVDSGDPLELTLTWQALRAPETRFQVIVTLVNDQGKVVLRRDVEPAAGTRPTTGWLEGEYVVDSHSLRTSRDLPDGRYRLEIAVAERDTGRLLRASDGSTRFELGPDVSVE